MNTPELVDGRPIGPYYNNQLDAVTTPDGSGGFALKIATINMNPTLQQVCDTGNTTTTKITATNGSAISSASDDGQTAVAIKTAADGSSQSLSFQQPDYLSNLITSEFADNYNWSLPNRTGTIALIENFGYNVFTVSIGIGDTSFTLPVDPSTGNVLVSIIPANSSNSAEVLKGGFWAQDNDTNYLINLLVPSTIAGDCDFYVTSFKS